MEPNSCANCWHREMCKRIQRVINSVTVDRARFRNGWHELVNDNFAATDRACDKLIHGIEDLIASALWPECPRRAPMQQDREEAGDVQTDHKEGA